MLTWAIAAPLLFGLLLVILARLEDWVVAPIDRADRITKLMESSTAEDLEQAVAQYLAPVLKPRPVRIAGTEPAGQDPDTKPLKLPLLRNRSA